jgi:hypothetical protein
MGFGDAALPAKEKALADRIVKGTESAMRRVLWEDRQIRSGKRAELDESDLA